MSDEEKQLLQELIGAVNRVGNILEIIYNEGLVTLPDAGVSDN